MRCSISSVAPHVHWMIKGEVHRRIFRVWSGRKTILISVRMAYLSLPYDKPNLPNRQLYTHVAIATSAVMTYERLSFTTEKVDHCRIWSFSIGLLYSRSERSALFNAASAVNCLLVVLSVVYWDVTPTGESWSAETPADK